MQEPHSTADEQPDHILPEVRSIALVVIPILLTAFLVLYLMPESNGDHFAWPVKPRMSSMMLGATYFTGVIYFTVVVRASSWHQVRLGMLPVTLFASLLGIATLLHWDKFSHAKPHFWLWLALYWVLPFVLIRLWYKNERHAYPLPIQPDEVFLGDLLRIILVLVGLLLAVTGLMLFLIPTGVAEYWPWTITPLTAQVIASELALFSFFMIEVAVVARWSQVRSLLYPQLISPFLFAYSIYASWSDFDQSRSLTWVFIAFVVIVFLVGFPAVYFPFEARRRRNALTDI